MALYLDFGTLTNPFPGAPNDVGQTGPFVSRLIGTLTFIAGIAMTGYFILGAVQWSTSAGDKAQVEAAKKTLTNAVIGMVIIVATYMIVGLLGRILGFTPLAPKIFGP
ncbi:MAG: hypothetical protein Q8N84_04420 [bacterium]|nr:hypothetical protein [bacterium]